MGGDQQSDGAGLAHGHRRLHVTLEEEALDGHAVRVMLRHQPVQRALELGQSLRVSFRRMRPHHPRVNQPQLVRLERHDTETEGCGAGVDAERDHRAIVPARLDD